MKEMHLTLLYINDYSIARFGNLRKEFPPIGLLYLAAACEKVKIKVKLIDLLSDELTKMNYCEVIGISINSSYVYPYIRKQLSVIKKLCKYLVVGGQHSTQFPQETFCDIKPDALILGEAENVFPNLVKSLYSTGLQMIHDINGIVCKDNFKTSKYSERCRIQNLDELEFPARHLLANDNVLLNDRIYKQSVKSVSIITSRGCPHSCKFCGNVYKGFFHRSAKNVELEIQDILEKYPETGGLVFLDENLLFNKKHVKGICNILKKYEVKWTCNARIDGYTVDIVKDLKSSGCLEVKYGIESGSQRILDSMDKKITLEQISETLKGTHESGINTKCFILFGYPGDDIESANETIKFLNNHKRYIDRINLFSFAPLPGSPIYREIESNCRKIDFKKLKIYHQFEHWWGNDEEFENLKKGYELLAKYISGNFGENYGKNSSSEY